MLVFGGFVSGWHCFKWRAFGGVNCRRKVIQFLDVSAAKFLRSAVKKILFSRLGGCHLKHIHSNLSEKVFYLPGQSGLGNRQC